MEYWNNTENTETDHAMASRACDDLYLHNCPCPQCKRVTPCSTAWPGTRQALIKNQVVMEPSSKQEWWNSRANISAIKDYAIQQGLLVKATRDPSDETVTNVAVTLTPSLFPRELFDLARSIAVDLNSLVDHVSRDELFLENALKRYL